LDEEHSQETDQTYKRSGMVFDVANAVAHLSPGQVESVQPTRVTVARAQFLKVVQFSNHEISVGEHLFGS